MNGIYKIVPPNEAGKFVHTANGVTPIKNLFAHNRLRKDQLEVKSLSYIEKRFKN